MKKILWSLGFLPIIVVGVVMRRLPAEIPIHFNLQGQIDSWGSKYMLIGIALLAILVNILIVAGLKVIQKKANSESNDKRTQEMLSNSKMIIISGIITQIIINSIVYFIIFQSLGLKEDGFKDIRIDIGLLVILIGVVFILFGNIMPKCKPNSIIGIRTKWSTSNDKAWKLSQLSGGKLFIAAGVLIILSACFFTGINVIIAMSIIVSLLIIGIFVTSYMAYKKYI